MDPSGRNVEGLIVTRDKRLAVATQRRSRAIARAPRTDDSSVDTFLTEFDDSDTTGQTWQCDVEKMNYVPGSTTLHATGVHGLPVTENGISGSQHYAIKIDIETDNELYVDAGSNSTTLTDYITNLTGAVSTIYNRDLNTNVTQGTVHIYTTASDPWTSSDSATALGEVGDYYHITYGGPTTSSVVMLSGKPVGAGIAWAAIAEVPNFSAPADPAAAPPSMVTAPRSTPCGTWPDSPRSTLPRHPCPGTTSWPRPSTTCAPRSMPPAPPSASPGHLHRSDPDPGSTIVKAVHLTDLRGGVQ